MHQSTVSGLIGKSAPVPKNAKGALGQTRGSKKLRIPMVVIVMAKALYRKVATSKIAPVC